MVPGAAWSRSSGCHEDGESLVESSSDVKPGWVDKTHYSESKYEYFVGMATQNSKVEDAKRAAEKNGEKVVIESLGVLSQPQYQSVLNLDIADSKVHDMLGVIGFPTFIQHKEIVGWYHEKWVSYSKCQPTYFYNAWVLLRVPKGELAGEQQQAAAYLKHIQAKEVAKTPNLMPSQEPLHLNEVSKQKKSLTSAEKSLETQNDLPEPEETGFTKPFGCGSFAIAGGYSYLPAITSPMGRQDNGVFNFNFDGEWGLARNVCMGAGVGWAMTNRKNATTGAGNGNGHIVPFYLRFDFKGPLDYNRRFIGSIGALVGPAVLYGFDENSATPGKQKTTAAFMAGVIGGLEVRVQKSIYITLTGTYSPIFYKQTINMVQAMVGLRVYFWGLWNRSTRVAPIALLR